MELAQALNGLGLPCAQAIVAYREANGPFSSVDQLVDAKGIGARERAESFGVRSGAIPGTVHGGMIRTSSLRELSDEMPHSYNS